MTALDPAAIRSALPAAHRVVVKIGSSSLTGPDGHLDVAALRALVEVLAERHAAGTQVVLVTSGAVAAGIGPLGLTARPKDLATMQAAASVGQGLLVARYAEAFSHHGIRVGQVLLTAEDTVRRLRYRNAQRSLSRLLALGVVPVVNENDAVTTDELKFGDNDRLAALVSHLVRADALVLLTDVDGLHDRNPSKPGAQRIAFVGDLAEVADVPVTSRGSAVGTGGMVTKLESVRIATASGITVVLTAARNAAAALAGSDVGTLFAATGRRTSARRLWIAHAARVRGRLPLDDGAARAVRGGRASRSCRRVSRASRASSTPATRSSWSRPTARSSRAVWSPSTRPSSRRSSGGGPPSCARCSARATTARWSTATTWCSTAADPSATPRGAGP